jgi:hypothetical protein
MLAKCESSVVWNPSCHDDDERPAAPYLFRHHTCRLCHPAVLQRAMISLRQQRAGQRACVAMSAP